MNAASVSQMEQVTALVLMHTCVLPWHERGDKLTINKLLLTS